MYRIQKKETVLSIRKYVCMLSFACCVLSKASAQLERNNVFMGGANLAAMGLSGLKTSAIGNEISMEGVGGFGGSRLLYSQINGSPYLVDSFQTAAVYSRDNKFLGNYKVRFNTASQQFHFINEKSQENVIPENLVGRIIVGNGDTGNSTQVFSNCITGISMNGINVDKYVQVLAEGEASFYKYIYKHVISKENSLKAEPDYYFATSVNYFLHVNGKITYLKKLSESAVKELLPEMNNISNVQKEYNFKNESGILAYVNDWNSSKTIKK